MGTSIMHRGREYAGGGGTNVVANPQGTATADLDTIQIGEVVYDIPGSGGGGGGKGYTSTLLWDYTDDNSGVIPYDPVSLTLRSSIDNFDTLVVEVVSVNGDISSENWNGTFIAEIDINALKNSYHNNYIIFNSHGERTCRFYIEGTTFQKTINNIANTNGIVRVYGIKFTGGGGGGETPFSEEVIYENPVGASGAAQNIEITKKMSNFDAACIIYSTTNDGGYSTRNESYYSPVFCRSDDYFTMLWYPTYGNRWITLTGDPESTTVSLATGQYGEAAGYTPIVYEIRGVKYGSGGSGGSGLPNSEIIDFGPGDGTTSRTFTLERTPKRVVWTWDEGGTSSSWYSYYSFIWGDRRAYGIGGNTDSADSGQYSKVVTITYGSDGKSFTITGPNAGNAANTSGANDKGLLYLEYGSGSGSGGGSGTEVEANPSDPATDTLNTIKIGDTVYDIEWSGGGSGTVDTLYKAQSTAPPQTITFNKSVEDYNFLITHIKSSNTSSATIGYTYTVDALASGNIIGGELAAGNGWIWYTYTDNTTLTYLSNQSNYYIDEISGVTIGGGSGGGSGFSIESLFIGDGSESVYDLSKSIQEFDLISVQIRYSRGGDYRAETIFDVESFTSGITYRASADVWFVGFVYTDDVTFTKADATDAYITEIKGIKIGGTDVEANPQDTPTDTLETIKIGSVVYDIAGSAGGGKGYLSTLLWDYTDDNSGVIPYDPVTLTLHDNINNYDMLVAEIVSHRDDISSASWNSTSLLQIDVEALNSSNNNNYLAYTSYYDRSSRFYIKDTTFQKTINNVANINGIVRVYGVKYGGGASKGSVYVEESIYSASVRATTMNLANTIDRYDAIEIEVSWTYNSQKYQISEIVTTKRILNSNAYSELSLGINVYRYITLRFTDNETISLLEDGSSGLMYVSEIKGIKYGSSSSNEGIEYPTGELIQIPAGDDTTSRTFSFDRAPKRITATWNNSDGSWIGNWNFVWGDSHVMYLANTKTIATSGDYGGIASITYGADGKSFTITGANSFGAMNDNGSGTMYVDYGIGTSGSVGAVSEVITMWNTHIADGDTIGFVLNKKYNNPYVMATNVLPKTSWGGLVVVDEAYGVTYDKNDNTLFFKVYTNSAQNYDIKWLVFDLDNDDYQKGSIYSTDEKIIGKWIDGSTLYQKTINTGQLPNNTTKAVAHDIVNIKKIIEISGYSTDGTNFGTLPYAGNNGWSITLYANDTNVYIASINDFSTSTESYVTLKYTKSP